MGRNVPAEPGCWRAIVTSPFFLIAEQGEVSSASFQQSTLRRFVDLIQTREQVLSALGSHRSGRWLIPSASALALFVDAIGRTFVGHRILSLGTVLPARRELLEASLGAVIACSPGVRMLPLEDLVEALSSSNAEDLFIGGVLDEDDGVLILYRGNLERMVVPLSWLRALAPGRELDIPSFSITDYGQTVQIGDFEVATDAILYEFDADARRRMKDRALAEDLSFGASLRRLRLNKGLSRRDFPGISEKTIARIERGETPRPHGGTLLTIAKRLGVDPAEIESF